MICPLCKTREVTDRAALACERKGYRFVCSACLTEQFRSQRPKAWPKLEMGCPVRFYGIEKVERAVREAA